MEKIRNPFAGNSNYRCFGCSPENSEGLRMRFSREGDWVISRWEANPQFEGWKGVLHGGIQATLLDEVAAWAVMALTGTSGATTQVSLSYLQPCPSEAAIIVARARVTEQQRRRATMEVRLESQDGDVYTRGTIEYAIFPEAVARRRFGYPGVDAFRES